jgi:hypothetical protein
MPKLMQNRISVMLTKDAIDAYKKSLKLGRDLLPSVPTVSDEDLKSWDKMGDVKRLDYGGTQKGEYGGVMGVFIEDNAHLEAPLSIEEAKKDLSVYDGIDDIISALDTEKLYYLRLKTIAGAEALNMLKCCEEETTSKVNKGNEAALVAQNKLNKLTKSAKSSGSAAKTPDDPNAKTFKK